MANSLICSVPDCGKVHFGKGYCNMHYMRLRRHGSHLAKKGAANGEATKFYNDIVIHYDGDECLIWPYWRNRGYAMMRRDETNSFVSRFLCKDINGEPPTSNHEAAHSCGNGHLGCVTKGHLSWKTPAENSADRLIHGTHGRGEQHPQAKLSETQVREIISLKGIETAASIANRFDVTTSLIYSIHGGRRWGWLNKI